MRLSKLAALAALGVAVFPCRCGTHDEIIRGAHALSALTMFLILAFFCLGFRRRAQEKGHPQARMRSRIYTMCGTLIVIAIIAVFANLFSGGALERWLPRLTYWGETLALTAFGVSWLTASRVAPGITSPQERFSPLRTANPAD